MKESEISGFLSYASPMLSSLFSLIFAVLLYRDASGSDEKYKIKLLIPFFVSGFCSWSLITTYVAFPYFFTVIHSFVYVFFLILPIFLYKLVYSITRIDEAKKFPSAHFIFPVAVTVVSLIWSSYIPFDVQLGFMEHRGVINPEYKAYSYFFTAKPRLFFIVDLIYATLAFIRISNYSKRIENWSADIWRSNPQWMVTIIILTAALLPVSGVTFFFEYGSLTSTALMFIPASLNMLRDGTMIYIMASRRYIVFSDEDLQSDIDDKPFTEARIAKLNEYMLDQKPYLNPKLKITDLCKSLIIGRTSLSNLINDKFGMSFSRWINTYRLRETEVMRNDPQYNKLSETELVEASGFSSYRCFVRFEKNERERKRPLMG